ncbi:CD48 antigen-like isoform X2 [Engystomops pustulosus]|uniref:CD48 antigen-like isoform X2 n=1 Tax=Engystomops pustulosus TaxID=76066 RepID=UPI003AFA1D94
MICLPGILMGIYLKCILCEGSCRKRNHVVGSEGHDVLLQVDLGGITGDITWFISGNHFATTKSGKAINIRDHRYQGKVYSMEDGSLLMNNVSREDQGTYRASTLRIIPGKVELCAVTYDLQVYESLSDDDIEIEYEVFSHEKCNVTFRCSARGSDVAITWERSTGIYRNVTNSVIYVQNPDPDVIYTCTAWNRATSASKSVTAWEHCRRERQQKPEDSRVFQRPEDSRRLNIIRLKLSACVFIIMCFIFAHHMKTEMEKVSSVDDR